MAYGEATGEEVEVRVLVMKRIAQLSIAGAHGDTDRPAAPATRPSLSYHEANARVEVVIVVVKESDDVAGSSHDAAVHGAAIAATSVLDEDDRTRNGADALERAVCRPAIDKDVLYVCVILREDRSNR